MKLKNFLLLFVFLASTVSPKLISAQDKNSEKKDQQAEIKWYTFEEAIKLNKKKPKKIFIDVYTDWCGWCKKMDAETFKDPIVAKYINDNFYAVKFNAEQKEPATYKGKEYINPTPDKPKSPHQLAVVLLKQEMRYPSYAILDGDSEWIFKFIGYKVTEDLMPILKYYGDDQYKVMSWTEYNDTKSL